MNATLLVPLVLRRYSEDVDTTDVSGETVLEGLESAFAKWPRLRERVVDERGALHPYLLLFQGGTRLDREALATTRLEEGAVLDLVGAVEGGEDVRMRGFRTRTSVEDARAAALADLVPCDAVEVALGEAHGRALAEEVASAVDVPPFDRSAMDGYAVRAADTFGATAYAPLSLELVGESMPGTPSAPGVAESEACRIMTGAPVPPGADAVVRAEDADEHDGRVQVRAAVPPGKNIGRTGEDVRDGEIVLRAGRRLRPQDLGLLASIGRGKVRVVGRPRVRILASGDELLAPGERPCAGFIVDSNSPMLAALAARDGGELESSLRVPDDEDQLREALLRPGADVILCVGGSSVGREDRLPLLVAETGRLFVHGVAMRPSAPTGIGQVRGARVFLLPGNPVSCLCAYDFFAGPALRRLGGLDEAWPYRKARYPLERRITSMVGRVDYARIAVEDGRARPLAVSGASILSSTTRASGFAIVPAESEGIAEGDEVLVYHYDAQAFR